MSKLGEEMNRSGRSVLVVFAVLFLIPLFLAEQHSSASDTPAQLPSIRACTASELNTITAYLTDVTTDYSNLQVALDSFDLDEVKELAVELHRNWYETSPDIPYCAQGVHTRLLVDRAIEVTALAGLSMYYGDFELALEYSDLIEAASADLGTYGRILGNYQ